MPPIGPPGSKFTAAELANAQIIVNVAFQRGLGLQGAVIGVMTAITESTLNNLNYGDATGPDSRGLFQQRLNWGPIGVRMDPVGASNLFYDALINVPNWKTGAPWEVAQTVQGSQFQLGYTGSGSDGTVGWNYHQNYADGLAIATAQAPAGGFLGAILRTPAQILADLQNAIISNPSLNTGWPLKTGVTPDGGIGANVLPNNNFAPATGTDAQIAALPHLGNLAGVAIIPFAGLPVIGANNRLSRVLLSGKTMHADLVDATISASMSYSSAQVNQFTLVLQDSADATIMRSGLMKLGVTLDYADQHTDVRGISTADGKGGPTITVKGRSRVVSRMKALKGPGNWGSLTPAEWLKARGKEVGASVICQPFPAAVMYRQSSTTIETDWDVLQRIAGDVGALAFEYDQILFFGKPTWLTSRQYHRNWAISWTNWSTYSNNIDGMPIFTGSSDSPETLVFGMIGANSESIRPGDVVTLYGNLPIANGAWFTTGVDIPYQLGASVKVTCARIIDPIVKAKPKPVAAFPGIPGLPVAPGSDPKGAGAAAYALSKVGPPNFYVYAGNGPQGFDCSGLTQQAWLTQGVNIPRTSIEQSTLPPVALNALQPGDLVTYYQPVSHVAIYVGNGDVVSATDVATGIRRVSVAGAGPNPTGHRPPHATVAGTPPSSGGSGTPGANNSSNDDRFHAIVTKLRAWGVTVNEQAGAYGRNNGNTWNGSGPSGHIHHHFVVSDMSPGAAQGYVDMLVNGYGSTPGPVVNWFVDVAGIAYLIATGPANHSGQGNSNVLARVKADQAPLGPAATFALGNDFNGNSDYLGTETQHPGDATPYPAALIDTLIKITAAECISHGWTANRAIMHYEHTDRKIDMSWLGGPTSNVAGDTLRSRVAAQINIG